MILTAITEGLSQFRLISPIAVLISWTGINGGLGLMLCCRLRTHPSLQHLRNGIQQDLRNNWISLRTNRFLGFATLSLLLLIVMTGILAVLAPPNNWDAMTYHMSRVVNWIQNHSVAHYATPNLRQVDAPPWSSFALLHLQLLSGGDRLANFVQWFSMLGSLVGVSLIARQLGANARGQILSCVMCATLPMGLLQSVSAQNDYVTTFWLVCFTVSLLQLIQQPPTIRLTLATSASIGLAVLTKGTAYIYAAPLCLIWIAHVVRSLGRTSWKIHRWPRTHWAIVMGSIAPAVLLNANHWWRNIQAFHTPLGLSGDITKNQLFTPAAIVSILIRNIAIHLPVPSQAVNHGMESIVLFIHTHLLNLDLNDSRTTFSTVPFHPFHIPVTLVSHPIYLHEDVSGNPIHLILLLISMGLYLRHKRVRNRQRTLYLLSLLSIVLLFCTLVAWQPWAVRLHLPLFVLSTAFMGCVLSEVWRLPLVSFLLVFSLTLNALPYTVFNASRLLIHHPLFQVERPLAFEIQRPDSYFIHRLELKAPYTQAMETVLSNGCRQVGLYTNGDTWDYPFWAIAQHHPTSQDSPPVRFRFVALPNESQTLPHRDEQTFLPCAILAVDQPHLEEYLTLDDFPVARVPEMAQDWHLQGQDALNSPEQEPINRRYQRVNHIYNVQVYFRQGLPTDEPR